MNRLTDIVKHLIILNVIVFIAMQTLHFLPNFSLFFPESKHFAPYQLVTHMFAHSGLPHLAFNMLSLFFLGPYVERELGPQKFLLLYLLSGLGALIAHIAIAYLELNQVAGSIDPGLMDKVLEDGRGVILSGKQYTDVGLAKLNEIFNIPVLGASGAVYGVMLAFAYMFPNVKMMLLFFPFPIKAKYLAMGLIAYDLFFGVGQIKSGIAHFAHLGGGITGLILVMFFLNRSFRR